MTSSISPGVISAIAGSEYVAVFPLVKGFNISADFCKSAAWIDCCVNAIPVEDQQRYLQACELLSEMLHETAVSHRTASKPMAVQDAAVELAELAALANVLDAEFGIEESDS